MAIAPRICYYVRVQRSLTLSKLFSLLASQSGANGECVSELLADFLTKEIEAPVNIIGRGLLPVESKLEIIGKPKLGKSFLVLNIALDLVQGRNLFGAQYPNGMPVFPVTGKHRVLYIEKEIGQYSLRDRLKSMSTGLDLSNLDLFVTPRDSKMSFSIKQGAAIEAEIAEIRPKVVILDPWAKFHSLQENDNAEMSLILSRIDELIEKYHCAFIIVHHEGHSGEFPRSGLDAGRGATSIAGDMDSGIHFTRISSKSAKEPTFELDFDTRHGAPIENIRLKKLESGLFIYAGSAGEHEDDKVTQTALSDKEETDTATAIQKRSKKL